MAYLRSVFMRNRHLRVYILPLISLFFIICQGCAQTSPPQSYGVEEIRPGAWSMDSYIPDLLEKTVGVVVNHTSLVGETHLVDTLLQRGVNVAKIYAPEHGLRGEADAGAHIEDGVDSKTGIPVISIYGDKKKPTVEDLKGIDILVFDIQDVGARFYTYISTLHYIMEAAGENNIPLIVLDRPNPNGHYVDGPVLDTSGYRSFVGMHPIPVVYGMTIGELGQMINGEQWIDPACILTVIPCENYDHQSMYDLPVKPSPNLPNLKSILLYPGICFFEGSVASLGRGTLFPFQVVGHPEYPNKDFSFTPVPTPGAKHPPLEGKECYGVDLTETDIDSLYGTRRLDLTVLLHFYKQMPKKDFFNAAWFDKLAGGPSLRKAIEAGWSEEEIRASWKEDLEAFKSRRKLYLLYPE